MAEIPQPWHPAPYDENIVYALQALAAGKASEDQQKTALEWIVFQLCGTYDATFYPDSERNTTFAEAKRHVGLQLVKMIRLQPNILRKKRGTNG